MNLNWDYDRLKKRLENVQLPAMVVDMDALNHNIDEMVKAARGTGHTIRIATKVSVDRSVDFLLTFQSVRVPALIQHILERGSPVVRGLMCYSVPEADFLFSEFGMDDIMVAYPAVQEGLCEVTTKH